MPLRRLDGGNVLPYNGAIISVQKPGIGVWWLSIDHHTPTLRISIKEYLDVLYLGLGRAQISLPNCMGYSGLTPGRRSAP